MNCYIRTTLYILVISTSYYDMQFRKIPNILSTTTLAIFIALHSATGEVDKLFFGAAGLLLGFGMLMPLHMLGIVGAGDVKLMTAVGAALGPDGVLTAFVFTTLCAGIYALLRLLSDGKALQKDFQGIRHGTKAILLGGGIADLAAVKLGARSGIPYAPFVALGVAWADLLRFLGYPYLSLF